ncbi:MAG: hypothetical protein NVS2B7_28500 [Herpetosiphon sp.]
MIFLLFARTLSVLLDFIILMRQSDRDKDIEILLLRHQLRILQRKQSYAPHISRWEKLTLVILASKLTRMTHGGRARLCELVFLFKPETLLKWHRDLVRRKWTFKQGAVLGRPAISSDLRALLLRLAKENPTWGYGKLQGELLKLGYVIGRSTVRDALKHHRVSPAPERSRRGSTWRTFLGQYKGEMLACDFFTVETAWLKTLYVLFFIEIGSRRVHFAGCTTSPTAGWVAQQARQVSWQIQDSVAPVRFLIHDRDTKFPAAFDAVFTTEQVKIIRTPVRAPNANAYAERWIRSIREECLDKVIILNERHLHRVLTTYVDYFNHARPHQGLDQRCPIPVKSTVRDGPIERRDLLGGVLHDYYRRAA